MRKYYVLKEFKLVKEKMRNINIIDELYKIK